MSSIESLRSVKYVSQVRQCERQINNVDNKSDPMQSDARDFFSTEWRHLIAGSAQLMHETRRECSSYCVESKHASVSKLLSRPENSRGEGRLVR